MRTPACVPQPPAEQAEARRRLRGQRSLEIAGCGGTGRHDGQRSSEERSASSLDVELFNLEYLARYVLL